MEIDHSQDPIILLPDSGIGVEAGDPQLGSPSVAAASKEEAEEPAPPPETDGAESSRGGEKRKRGGLHLKTPAKKSGEEDVCFICFDGGNLVLCDRRGCTKAYHPACVNLDEAFFKGKTPWNCGWHICSICEKASQYMCYTCTYSLCKGCIKKAGLFCVRGNKGFCETCMKTVMLIENGIKANKEMPKVDFSDKNSWEYLFKDYWLDLKGKLSLTLEELNKAKNPFDGSGALAFIEGPSHEPCDANDDQGSSSDSSSGLGEASSSKGKKVKRSRSFTSKGGLRCAEKVGSEGKSVLEDVEWASKELLEFVGHMKDGDTSVLSRSDVKALLFKYIKRNNLRDPRKKTQIICDSRLGNLFGKERVGHFEMLKLLEPHFLLKDKTMEGSSHKRFGERGPQTNLDDFAAIDAHNINLICLRRKVLEDMLADTDRFRDKVVGSFVRIRISGTAQNQDMYRLVQVVGIGKSEEAYKTGRTTEDVTLEILNQNSIEVVSIDTVSNQQFTEEECKHLRQSIKCGHIGPLKVGEVQGKARALQKVRVKDWLETEMSRLSNLRDRASEKGRRRELNECLKKLQLLSTPEERSRLLEETPEVHDDPTMDPSYVWDEDEWDRYDKKQDNRWRPRGTGFSRKGKEPISPGEGGLASNDDWMSGINMSSKDDTVGAGESAKEPSLNPGSSNWGTASGLKSGGWNSQLATTSGVSSDGGAGTDGAQENVPVPISSSGISETDKLWHYQDPSEKIQGPFSMAQLHKWSKIGYFPSSLKIWKTSEKQEDSIFLTDAMNEMFQKDDGFPQLGGGTTTDDGKENEEGGWSGSNSLAGRDEQKNSGGWESNWNKTSGPTDGNAEVSKADAWGTQTSAWTSQAPEVVSSKEEWTGNSSQAWDSSKSHNSGLKTPVDNSGQNAGNSWNTNSAAGSESSNPDFGKPNISKGWETPSSAVASGLTADVWGTKADNGNDSSNLPTAPEQGSGWTVGQSAGNKWSASAVRPTDSGWGTSSNSGSEEAQQSTPVVTGTDKIAPDWGTKVCATEKSTLGEAAAENSDTICDITPKISNDSWCASQVKSSMGSGTTPEGNADAGWGTSTQGNEDAGWGAAHQGKTSMSLEKTAVQGNTKSSWGTSTQGNEVAGWGAAPQGKTNMSLEKIAVQGNTKSGWGTSTQGNEDAGWGAAPQGKMNMSLEKTVVQEKMKSGWGASQGSENAGWGTASQGNMSATSEGNTDAGWGTAAQGSDDAGWGAASQGKTNMSWGKAVVQGNTKSGWGGARGSENADWGTASEGNTSASSKGNTDSGWGTATQGNEDAGWGAASQGKTNMDWGKEAVQGNTKSGWGASQGSADSGWGTASQGNMNGSWGASSGNSSRWGGQQKNTGERFSGDGDRGFQSGDSAQGGGKPSWNRSMSSGDGGPSRPPRGPRVCKFHESGHCKKGSSCNFLHP